MTEAKRLHYLGGEAIVQAIVLGVEVEAKCGVLMGVTREAVMAAHGKPYCPECEVIAEADGVPMEEEPGRTIEDWADYLEAILAGVLTAEGIQTMGDVYVVPKSEAKRGILDIREDGNVYVNPDPLARYQPGLHGPLNDSQDEAVDSTDNDEKRESDED